MYYIINQTNQIIAIDDALLGLLQIKDIEELASKTILNELQFTLPTEENVTITHKDNTYQFHAHVHTLSSVLGGFRLVHLQDIKVKEDEQNLIDVEKHTHSYDNFDDLLFKDNPPKCTLQIVAYTLEEPPFFRTRKMGSFIHAQSLKNSGQKVKLAIVLDMIGFFSDEENSQSYPLSLMSLYYPSKANYISIVSNLSFKNIQYVRKIKSVFSYTSKLPTYSINAFSFLPGIDFSDHHNYWKFDYPAILITDTAFYRSDNYHTMNDTPDTLNYEKMAKVIGGVFNMVHANGRKLNFKQAQTE